MVGTKCWNQGAQGRLIPNTEKKVNAGMSVQVKYEHEGLERAIKGVINVMYSSPRESLGGLFIGVVSGVG
jgi:hypothetical protein